jgi:hypothetical protein
MAGITFVEIENKSGNIKLKASKSFIKVWICIAIIFIIIVSSVIGIIFGVVMPKIGRENEENFNIEVNKNNCMFGCTGSYNSCWFNCHSNSTCISNCDTTRDKCRSNC